MLRGPGTTGSKGGIEPSPVVDEPFAAEGGLLQGVERPGRVDPKTLGLTSDGFAAFFLPGAEGVSSIAVEARLAGGLAASEANAGDGGSADEIGLDEVVGGEEFVEGIERFGQRGAFVLGDDCLGGQAVTKAVASGEFLAFGSDGAGRVERVQTVCGGSEFGRVEHGGWLQVRVFGGLAKGEIEVGWTNWVRVTPSSIPSRI